MTCSYSADSERWCAETAVHVVRTNSTVPTNSANIIIYKQKAHTHVNTYTHTYHPPPHTPQSATPLWTTQNMHYALYHSQGTPAQWQDHNMFAPGVAQPSFDRAPSPHPDHR